MVRSDFQVELLMSGSIIKLMGPRKSGKDKTRFYQILYQHTRIRISQYQQDIYALYPMVYPNDSMPVNCMPIYVSYIKATILQYLDSDGRAVEIWF